MKKIIIAISIIITTFIIVAGVGLYVREINLEKREKHIKEEINRVEKERLNEINKIAGEIADELNNYEINNHKIFEIEEGMTFDFIHIDKTAFNDIENCDEPLEGKLYKDYDNTMYVLENVKICGMYCTYENKTLNCNKTNKSDDKLSQSDNPVYTLGDAITLSDNSKWHVIKDSNKYSKYVTLLYDGVVNVKSQSNKNYNVEEGYKDGIAFDKSNSEVYDITKEGNIGYYIENIYKKTLPIDVVSVRLLTQNEYGLIKDRIDTSSFNYDMVYSNQVKNWFSNHTLGNWWIMDEDQNNGYISTVIWANGFHEACCYAVSDPTSQFYLRPVITVEKSKLVNN